ncbi:MAG: TrmH family RNA methyltransferase [Candidatus Limnocylindria bacterium]
MPANPELAAEPIVLEGHVSVEAALEAGVRSVQRIWAVRPGDRRLGRLRALARRRGVLIDRIEADRIDEIVVGRSHGGVVGLVGPRGYLTMRDLLTEVGESGQAPLVVMLDGIEDPHNFGQAIRALHAAGVDGVVVRRRSWETAAAIVTRASAGASELLLTATVDSAQDAAAAARAAGLQVACTAARGDAVSLHDADLRAPMFLLIGGERRGVTRSFLEEADLLLRIPYGRDDAAELGAAAAAAVIGFEALRQRRAKRGRAVGP